MTVSELVVLLQELSIRCGPDTPVMLADDTRVVEAPLVRRLSYADEADVTPFFEQLSHAIGRYYGYANLPQDAPREGTQRVIVLLPAKEA